MFVRAVAAPTPVAAVPAGAARGASETISVTGTAFAPDATVLFQGTGITVLGHDVGLGHRTIGRDHRRSRCTRRGA